MIFHPQGGGQPTDTSFIQLADFDCEFIVQDVRSKDGIVQDLLGNLLLFFSLWVSPYLVRLGIKIVLLQMR